MGVYDGILGEHIEKTERCGSLGAGKDRGKRGSRAGRLLRNGKSGSPSRRTPIDYQPVGGEGAGGCTDCGNADLRLGCGAPVARKPAGAESGLPFERHRGTCGRHRPSVGRAGDGRRADSRGRACRRGIRGSAGYRRARRGDVCNG